MKSIQSNGLICVKNKFNIEFTICKIEYILNIDQTFKYIFTPYYDVINLVDEFTFRGIPGIELDLKKDVYIRDNIVPTFISERVPSLNREDFDEELQALNLEYMDPIEYLIRSNKKYSGDNLYVKPYKERKIIEIKNEESKNNSLGIIKIILHNLAQGNKLYINNSLINNDYSTFNMLLYIYEKGYNEINAKKQIGINNAKKNNIYKGRKPLNIDKVLFLEQIELIDKKIITINEALKNLNISKATFYRLKKNIGNLVTINVI